jgi:hypothetical protein
MPFSICAFSPGSIASIAAFSNSFNYPSPFTLATPSGPSCTRPCTTTIMLATCEKHTSIGAAAPQPAC